MATGKSLEAAKKTSSPIPHVLHVVSADVFARFGRMFRSLGLALAEEGVRVSLLTNDSAAAADLEGTPIEGCYFPALSGWSVWRLHGFLRRRFSPPPDVVHVWDTTSLGYFSEWTLSYGGALVIHITSQRDVERLKNRGVRSNEHLLAGCQEYLERLRKHWTKLPDPFPVLRPALLRPERVPELSVHDKTLGLLWTGVMDKNSRLDVLIEAAARLRANDCDLQVALIGRGPQSRRIWQEIRRRRLQDCFSLVAEPNLWDQTMVGADILVVPACQRELALAPLLTMALGKVVIASRDQLAEWFIENQTCLQFAPGSAVELAYHVTRAAAGQPEVLAMTRSAAEYVRQHHAITQLGYELSWLYQALRLQVAEARAARRAAAK